MSTLKIERLGGFAGFGGANSRLQSRGEIDTNDLSKEDKQTVDDLFTSGETAENTTSADTFRYRISRTTSKGTESVEVNEGKIPSALVQRVKDEIG